MPKDYKLKKRIHFYLYYLVIPAFIGFFCINYFLPLVKVADLDLNLMISIVTFIFGFLISVSFTMVFTRASNLRDSLATETARIVSMFKLSEYLGDSFKEDFIKKIDEYTIVTLRNYEKYDLGRKFLYGIYSDLEKVEIKNKFHEQIHTSFLSALNDFESARERIEALTSEKMLRGMKISNYILSGLLILLLFLNRGETFTNSLFIVLSSIIVFILLIIEDYERLRIGDYVNNISNAEQIFDLIGKERYYPKALLGRVMLEKGRRYRVGVYDSGSKEEKIFNLTYDSTFNIKLGSILDKFLKRHKV